MKAATESTLGIFLVTLTTATVSTAAADRVDVCHSEHVITIAVPALPAHLAHGDSLVDDEIACDSIDNDCDGETDEGCVVAPPDIVAWWPGDGSAADSAGANHGSLEGDTTLVADSQSICEAFVFDGVGDYVSVPSSTDFDFGTGSFSIELWFKTNDTGASGRYFVLDRRMASSPNTGFWLQVGSFDPGTLDFGVHSFPLETRLITDISSYFDNQWHHLAAIRSGASLSLYVDGDAIANSMSFGDTISINTTVPLRIGARFDGGRSMPGSLDEVTIYNRALSASEVEDIFAARSFGKCK